MAGINVTKRKIPFGTQHEEQWSGQKIGQQTSYAVILELAGEIARELDKPVENESIHLCGPAVIALLESRPEEVLDLAYEKLHTWPYQHVPTFWRRLYEDAALWRLVHNLRGRTVKSCFATSHKRRKTVSSVLRSSDAEEHLPGSQLAADEEGTTAWLDQIVKDLDTAISRSGAPGRAALFEKLFCQLDACSNNEDLNGIPHDFPVPSPQPLETKHGIPRAAVHLPFEDFQHHLEFSTSPLVIPGSLSEWPALDCWNDPTYFLRQTLHGRRLVPVELGRSYVDSDWSQTMLPFKDFLRTYMLPSQPEKIGYLAQHDLFTQIPSLRTDIAIPDYCFTSPPTPTGAAARTFGLGATSQLEEPLLNAWLGPKGTRTPLHTDAYHNILAQVVGYKYVRLYSPEQTAKLYPRGVDENGVDMGNTSQVDISAVRAQELSGATDEVLARDFHLVKDAEYVEGILAPGECLYIPLGWWHYVESLTVSFSVSFWWN